MKIFSLTLFRLKCDRSTPCQNCTKRGDPSACSYTTPVSRRKTGSRSQASGRPGDMQNRIDKLEGFVLSLMSSGNDPLSSTTTNQAVSVSRSSNSLTPITPQSSEDTPREASVESETDRVAKSFGVLHVNNNQAAYIGDSHWATILNEISEVKTYFREHQKQYEEALNTVEASRKEAGIQSTGPAFLLVGRNPPDFRELINRLPRKSEVDQLVHRYFQDANPGLRILHLPTWRTQYEQFWQNPGGSDASFLGQLYAICGLAMQSYSKNQDEPSEYQGRSQDLSMMYRGLTQQCLQLVNYSKIEQTTIETMILHVHAEHQKTGEADIGLWVLSRMIISLAMRTGIHRDGKNYSGITPFQCEIRRRLWTFLRTLDIHLSFTVGLPSMIRDSDTDTELPSNLNDADFDQDTAVMPPARSKNELTEVSYLIAKAHLASCLSRINATIVGTGTISYDEIIRLNDEVRDTYNGTFPALQVRTLEDFRTASDDTFSMRMNLSILYNKILCVLHRKYLTLSRQNTRFNPSRQACIDASLSLLRSQQIIEEAHQPDGQIHQSKWKLTASKVPSLMLHDFILAGTLISLDLLASVQAQAAGRSSGDIEIWGMERTEEQSQAIQGAKVIWESLKGQYVEAYKAHSICSVVQRKIQHCISQNDGTKIAQETTQDKALATNGNVDMDNSISAKQSERSAAFSLGTLSNGLPDGNWKTDNESPLRNENVSPPLGGNGQVINSNQFQASAMSNCFLDPSAPLNNNSFPLFSAIGGEIPANMDWVSLCLRLTICY